MRNKARFLNTFFLLAVVIFGQLIVTAPASAQGLEKTGFENICFKGQPLGECVQKIYLLALSFGALVAFLMTVLAGYRYMTAQGNSQAVESAKEAFAAALTGLVIIFVAFILLYLINPDLVRFNKTVGGSDSGGSQTQVASVTFSPNGGSSATSKTVTLSSATPGASIRYTIDGPDPLLSSEIYSAPITIFRTLTLKARAFKAGMDQSPVTSATFTIGGTATAVPPPGIKSWSGQDPLGLVWGTKETELKSALNSFISRWGSQLTVTQAFRPPEYADHIRSVWEAWRFLSNDSAGANTGYNCTGALHVTQALTAAYTHDQELWVQAEVIKHSFRPISAGGTPPACLSDHESGTAMDTWPVPPDFSGVKLEYRRWLRAALDSGLCHNIAGDEPHFILRAGSGLSDAQCLVE